METLCPRLQSGVECAGGTTDARSAGGAIAWCQPVDRLLLRKRDALPPFGSSRAAEGARRESRVAAVATGEAAVAVGQDSVPHQCRRWAYMTPVTQHPKGMSHVRSSADYVSAPKRREGI